MLEYLAGQITTHFLLKQLTTYKLPTTANYTERANNSSHSMTVSSTFLLVKRVIWSYLDVGIQSQDICVWQRWLEWQYVVLKFARGGQLMCHTYYRTPYFSLVSSCYVCFQCSYYHVMVWPVRDVGLIQPVGQMEIKVQNSTYTMTVASLIYVYWTPSDSVNQYLCASVGSMSSISTRLSLYIQHCHHMLSLMQ